MSDRIAELAALVDAATQGPWEAYCRDVRYKSGAWPEDEFLQWEINGPSDHTGRGSYMQKDAAAIVALRNHADALLAVARAAKAFRDANLAHGSEPTNVLDAAYDALTDALARLEATT